MTITLPLTVFGYCYTLKRKCLSKKIFPENTPPFRLLFFSDTHIQSRISRSFFPFLKWQMTDDILENLQESIALSDPHALLFGGDLAGMSSCFAEGVRMLEKLPPERKFALYGNWDKKDTIALSHKTRRKMLEDSGIQMLVNEEVKLSPFISLYGVDDTRMGFPLYKQERKKEDLLYLTAAHSPDTVPGRMREELFGENDFFLCGHTHGGQVRLPFFGAFSTSTFSGKKLERNWYEHKKSHAKMLITSGIGTTFIHTRLFCPPEIVLLEL